MVAGLWLPAWSWLRTARVCTTSSFPFGGDRLAVNGLVHDAKGPPSTEQVAPTASPASENAQVGVGSLLGDGAGVVMVGGAGATRSRV